MSEAEGIVLSLDLVHEREGFLSMTMRHAQQLLTFADGEPVPITLPEGCIGFMLVFDAPEAAEKFDSNADIVRLTMKE